MNISRELLKYQLQSRTQALAVAESAMSTPAKWDELMQCFLSDNPRLVQRAAWSVSLAAQQQPAMIQPYMDVVVGQLDKTLVHNAVIRNSLRILQNIEIPDAYHGKLLNLCFNFIKNRETAIAIKAFSLQILFNLTTYYPDIKNELKLVIQESIAFESAAFQSRGKKILAKL